ncbi:MAG TPA: T9SS type A sorting domain-containing protein [Patescibacteria group bacterium]|nr:T9SS type A sorting domain-containing protein [Patescibacteria group bacterium]
MMKLTRLLCCLTAALLLFSGHSLAQDSSNVSLAGRYFRSWEKTTAGALVGNYLYQLTGSTGLWVIDISDSENPETVTILEDVTGIKQLIYEGSYLFAVGKNSLEIYDVSQPSQPEFIIGHSLRGLTNMDVHDNLAFCLFDSCYFSIFDLSDPYEMTFMSGVEVDRQGIDVDYYGGVAVCDTLLFIFPVFLHDFMDPDWQPEPDMDTPIYDVSDPENPEYVSSLASSRSRDEHVALAGDFAFVTTRGESDQIILRVVDFSDVTNPEEVGRYAIPASPGRIIIHDDMLYLNCSNVVVMANIAEPANPEFYQPFEWWDRNSSMAFSNLYGDSLLIVSIYESRIGFIDVSNPADPLLVNLLTNNNRFETVSIIGNYGYIHNVPDHEPFGTENLQIADLQDMFNPEMVGATEYVRYFANHTEGHGYFSCGRTLLNKEVWDSAHALISYDLSDSLNPTALDTLVFQGDEVSTSLYYLNGYLWLVKSRNDETSMFQIDVSDPSDLTIIDSSLTQEVFGGRKVVALTDSILVLCDFISAAPRLYFLDIADPANPRELSAWRPGDRIEAVKINHENIYITSVWYYSIYQTTDNWESFELLDRFNMPTAPRDNFFFIRGSCLVTHGENRLEAWDVSEPSDVQLLGWYTCRSNIQSVQLVEDHYLLVLCERSLDLLDLSEILDVPETREGEPKSFRLSSAWPNPFNSTLSLAVELPDQSRLTLEVFNLLGQKVATITDGEFPAGSHRLLWPADNLASGSYLLRATANGMRQSQRISLIK